MRRRLAQCPAHEDAVPSLSIQEVDVVVIVAADILAGKTINETDWKRLAKAAAQIGKARNHLLESAPRVGNARNDSRQRTHNSRNSSLNVDSSTRRCQ